jgi:hypothetical protein
MKGTSTGPESIWFPESAEAILPRFELLGLEFFRPVPKVAPHLLSLHLLRALQDIATGLNSQRHRRSDGTPIDCISVFTDESEPSAFSVETDSKSAAVMSVGMARNLAVIAAKLGECLTYRYSSGSRSRLSLDARLSALCCSRDVSSDGEVEGALAGMAEPWSIGDVPIGSFAIFYDLVRLVWVHEWAHVLLGHTAFVRNAMGLVQLHEHSHERAEAATLDFQGHPRAHVLQGFELQADGFAVKYCVHQILEGWDAVNDMMGPNVNLVDRMIAFNFACAIFAVLWSSAEDSRYSEQPSTHPPAALRYMNFRDFQREICVNFDPRLAIVDAFSFGLIEIAAELAPEFASVAEITPVVVRTPKMKRLEALSDFLTGVNQSLAPNWGALIYLPRGAT